MSLITSDYFSLEINVPDSDFSTLDDHIERLEPEILRRLLGPTLAASVMAYSVASEQRIKDIVEGKSYTKTFDGYDHTIRWNGLANTDYVSLIAYYVFYYWARDHATQSMAGGELKASFENAVPTSPALRMSRAWVRLRQLAGYPGQYPLEPSLYNFLLEHESSYPEWVWRGIGSVNSFDL